MGERTVAREAVGDKDNSVVEEHGESRVARPHRLLVTDRESGRLRPPHHRHRLRVRHPRLALARRREGAAVLQLSCSGPPADSPSACPKCHRSPGSMKPPTSSPSTSSARLQAAPRAQRTQPCATIGASRLRVPRCSGRAYFASSRCRASHLHRGEQNLWFSATARNLRQQRSHRRSPNVRVTPRRSPSGRPALQVGHSVWFPWCGKNPSEQRLQIFIAMNHRFSAATTSGREKFRAGVVAGSIPKKRCISHHSSAEHDSNSRPSAWPPCRR